MASIFRFKSVFVLMVSMQLSASEIDFQAMDNRDKQIFYAFIDDALNQNALHTLAYTYPMYGLDRVFFHKLRSLYDSNHYRAGISALIRLMASECLLSQNLSEAALKHVLALTEKIIPNGWAEQGLVPISYRKTRSDHEKIAKSLTDKDEVIFKEIKISQLYKSNFIKESIKKTTITPVGNDFSHTVDSIVVKIKQTEHGKKQIKLFKKYIDVAFDLYVMNNFSGLMQVFIAINNVNIETYFEDGISIDAAEKYKFIKNLLNCEKNHSKYRRHIRILDEHTRYIPMMFVVLSDLTHLYDGAPEFIDSTKTHLNFNRLNNIAKIFADISRNQSAKICRLN